jgi:hypothetical protein
LDENWFEKEDLGGSSGCPRGSYIQVRPVTETGEFSWQCTLAELQLPTKSLKHQEAVVSPLVTCIATCRPQPLQKRRIATLEDRIKVTFSVELMILVRIVFIV